MVLTKTRFLKITLVTLPFFLCISIVLLIIGCSLKSESSQEKPPQELDDCIVDNMLKNRPDILEYFGSQGMDTSRSTWETIVNEWSRMDPEGFEAAKVKAESECKPGYFDCCPPDYTNPPINYIKNRITHYAQLLNEISDWDKYCMRCGRWNPLTDDDMPCMTFVSTIWYLAGVKDEDLISDGFSWYSPGMAWQNGETFYKYVKTYYPELIKGVNSDDKILCSEHGMERESNSYNYNTFVGKVNSNLHVGDILQYYGSLDGIASPYYKHSVIVVNIDSQNPTVASFGWDHYPSIDWTTMTFGWTRVRVIHLPVNSNIPLKPNFVLNPSFEGLSGNLVFQQGIWYSRKYDIGWIPSDIGYDLDLFAYSNENPYDNSKANFGYRHLIHSNKGKFETYQTINLEAGTYILRAYAYSDVYSDEYSKLNYIYLHHSFKSIPRNVNPEDPWKLIEIEDIKIDTDGNYEVGIHSNYSECHIDDMQLIKTQ